MRWEDNLSDLLISIPTVDSVTIASSGVFQKNTNGLLEERSSCISIDRNSVLFVEKEEEKRGI